MSRKLAILVGYHNGKPVYAESSCGDDGSDGGHWGVITGVSGRYAAHEQVDQQSTFPWPITVGGVSGTISANQAIAINDMAGAAVGNIVWLRPIEDGNWLYEWDRIPGLVNAETADGIYTVREATIDIGGWVDKPNQRTFTNCKERNLNTEIPVDSKVWLYREFSANPGQLNSGSLWFDLEKPTDNDCDTCQVYLEDVDIPDIVNPVPGVTYNIYLSLTGEINQYQYVCFGLIGCVWINRCDCSQVPWWCVSGNPNDICLQSVEPPGGSLSGPHATRNICENTCATTGTGTGTSGGITTVCCGENTPATLYAHFGGSLSSVGTVTLTWNPGFGSNGGWVGNSSTCSVNDVSFICNISNTNWNMVIGSIGNAGGPETDCDPFSWSSSGSNTGPCGGSFTVTVNTTP